MPPETAAPSSQLPGLAATMRLKVLLPSGVFAKKQRVLRIVAESPQGAFGLLPNRLDCVMPLAPGILIYETEEEGEALAAIDEGVLVKTGNEVLVSTRNAVAGNNQETLREAVQREFLTLDSQERSARAALLKLETGLFRRYVGFQHD